MTESEEEKHWSDPEEITLPSSGLKVSICRPTKAYLRFLHSQWPHELRDKCHFIALSGERGNWSREERTFVARQSEHLIKQAFIQAAMIVKPHSKSPVTVELDDKDTEFVFHHITARRGDDPLLGGPGTALRAPVSSSSGRVN